MGLILAIDLGGTRIRAAVFERDGGTLSLIRRAETLSRARVDPVEMVISRLIQIAREVVTDELIDAIGIAAPGPLDPRKGIILYAETLPGWREIPLVQKVSEAFSAVPVYLQNDANLAALAEYTLGAGKGTDPFLYLTVSTGIGGGVILHGRLFDGSSGLAIEPGQMRFIHPHDGKVYRLEELASGSAIGTWAKRRLAQETTRSLLITAGEIDGQTVGWAAQAGDTFALSVIHEAGEWFGLGLVNMIHLFNPQRIAIGGGVSQLGDLFLTPARSVVERTILHPAFNPTNLIQSATLGDDAGLFGAALYAQDQMRAAHA
jgi:glucokinase